MNTSCPYCHYEISFDFLVVFHGVLKIECWHCHRTFTEVSLEVARDANKRIVVYSEDWCEPCQKLKAWLKKKGLEFEERKPPKDDTQFVVLPKIKIGRWVVKGFSPEKIEEMLGRD